MKNRVVFATLLVVGLVLLAGCKPMMFEGKVLDMSWNVTHDGPMACKAELYDGAGGADVVLNRTKLVGNGAWVTYTQLNSDGTTSTFGPIQLADGEKIAKGEKCFECGLPPELVLVGGALGVVVPMILRGPQEHLVIPMGGPRLVDCLVQFSTEEGPFAFTLKGAAYRPTSPEGEGEPPIPLSVEITKPVAPASMTVGETLQVEALVKGAHRIEVKIVLPNGVEAPVQEVMSPATVNFSSVMSLVGDGNVTVQVKDLTTGQVVVASRKVTVNPAVPTSATVPDLTGLTETGAREAVGHTCLVVGVVTYQYHPTIPTGTVINWSPKGQVTCGTSISIVVSKGPEPPDTGVVPNVVGLPRVAAMTTIAQTCLVVGTVTEVYSSTVAAGLVISSTPSAGATVACGSAVDLTVSKGPQPTAVFSLTVSSPIDGSTVVGKVTVVGHVTGPNPVNIVVVPPDALNIYRVEGAIPPYDLSHEFPLTIAGTGLFTVRVTDLVTHEVLEAKRAVTVVLSN